MLWLSMIAMAAGQPAMVPTAHTLVYYNARMALREGNAFEAVKLWFLRNALEDQTGRVSPHDGDFHSVTWAALGDLGVCQDGHPKDKDGAGLWPLALHNWVVKNMGRRNRGAKTQPFTAFNVDRQQRFVSINDVLNTREMGAIRLFRGACVEPRLALVRAGEFVAADLSDRQVIARLLRHLLEESRISLKRDRVRGQAAIAARLFDLDLKLTALAEREARQQSINQAGAARQLGLSRGSITAIREEAPQTTLAPDSEAARILGESVHWPVSEWMSLSPDRRVFLFDHARAYGGDPATLDALALGIIDRLVLAGEGQEVAVWISRVGAPDDIASRERVWGGKRGQSLLALDVESGFPEGSVIALSRGVRHLERGELPESLRSMAYAVQNAGESRASRSVESLSLRWLSYVASQFEITEDLLITLQQLIPSRDYAVILEDLMWRSALRADLDSFETGLVNQPGRGALARRLELLHPLAAGEVGRFLGTIERWLAESPNETLRFLNQLIQRLELEPADVRAAHLPTLARLDRLLLPLATAPDGGRLGRNATSLLERSQALTEGLGGLRADASARERARALDPRGEVFVGSVRLAPADPLPWPFRRVEAPAPSVFTPLKLTPQEWRSRDGELVFGWHIEG
jgi:hypothetical protein